MLLATSEESLLIPLISHKKRRVLRRRNHTETWLAYGCGCACSVVRTPRLFLLLMNWQHPCLVQRERERERERFSLSLVGN